MLTALTTFLAVGLIVSLFLHWASDPYATPAERNVMTTTAYSVAGGAVVNVACAIIVRGIGAVPAGEELGACSPHALMSGAITARLHMYWINGYTHGEWRYIRDTPSRTLRSLDRGFDAAREELSKRGFLGGAAVEQPLQRSEL
jgi:hypothetical protein